jgi:hypothetical protein
MFALVTRLLRRGHAPACLPPFPDSAAEALAAPPADETAPAPAPEPDTAPGIVVPLDSPESRYHRIHPQTMALVEEMQSYAGFVEIMQAHLTNVCGETQAAAEDILGQALNIEGSVSGLVRHVGDTMQSDRLVDASDAMHLSVETGRAMIAELIRQRGDADRDPAQLDTVRAVQPHAQPSGRDRGRAPLHRSAGDQRAHPHCRAGQEHRPGSDCRGNPRARHPDRAPASDLNHELTEMDLMISEDLIAKVSSQQRTDDARTEDLQRSFAKLAEHMNTLNQFQADLIREVQRRGEDMRDRSTRCAARSSSRMSRASSSNRSAARCR